MIYTVNVSLNKCSNYNFEFNYILTSKNADANNATASSVTEVPAPYPDATAGNSPC